MKDRRSFLRHHPKGVKALICVSSDFQWKLEENSLIIPVVSPSPIPEHATASETCLTPHRALLDSFLS